MYSQSDIQKYAKKLNIPEEFIPRNAFATFTVKLVLHGHAGRHGYPDITIQLNNEVLFNGLIVEEQTLEFTVYPRRQRNLFVLSFNNKQDDDTVVENDVITRDKFLKIIRLEFDNIPLDPLKYFRYEPKYPIGYLEFVKDPPKVMYGDHLSFNGAVTIYVEPPVGSFLARQYFKDSDFLSAKTNLTVTNFKKLADFYTKLAHKD